MHTFTRFAAILGSMATLAMASSYNYVTLNPAIGANAFNRGGINNNGAVAAGFSGGYVYSGGPNGTYSYGSSSSIAQLGGVDDSGNITGFRYNNDFDGSLGLSGALASPSTFTVPGASYTLAQGISGNGKIAGYYVDDNTNKQSMFIKDGASLTTFDYPNNGFNQQYLWDVNNSGDAVGLNACCNQGVSFLKQGNTFTTITIPGIANNQVIAYGLNDQDQVVGYYNDNNVLHGFIWQSGVATTFDFPGAGNTILFDINDTGTIFGGSTNAGFGDQRNFLAIPVTNTAIPEPASMGLAGAALILLAGAARRSRY